MLTGLYLHGGLAFGEWAPVDFVAAVAHRLGAAALVALEGLHAQMAACSAYWRRNAKGLARATPADLQANERERD